ncbi:MAG: hypothetical protein AAF392_02155 [Bacteroidota bacterium]
MKKLMKRYSFFKRSYSRLRFGKYLLCLLLTCFIHNVAFSKEHLSFRKLLNQVHVNVSFGGGKTFYYNDVVQMHVFKEADKYYLYDSRANNVYLIRWFGGSYVCMKTYDVTSKPLNIGDEQKITCKGTGATFPIALSSHIDILRKFRVELGGTLLINKIKTLKPDKEHMHLGDYKDPRGTHYNIRPFAMLGFKLLENPAYTLLLNTQIGFDFVYGKLSDSRAVLRSFLPSVDIGITAEKHISAYFSAFSRLSYDRKIFLELFKPGALILKQQGLFLQLGVSLNCPELPRCPVSHCKAEIKHRHRGKIYRGASMLRGKDARGHRL